MVDLEVAKDEDPTGPSIGILEILEKCLKISTLPVTILRLSATSNYYMILEKVEVPRISIWLLKK